MGRIPLRALTVLVLTAVGLMTSSCGSRPSPQWEDQQRMERGHYG